MVFGLKLLVAYGSRSAGPFRDAAALGPAPVVQRDNTEPPPLDGGSVRRFRTLRLPHGWTWLSRTAPLQALIATLAVAAAGCGGGSSPSVASLGTTTSATTAASRTSASSGPALTPQKETAIDDAYAACMTGHGIEARAIHGGGVGFIVRPGSPGPGSSTFVAAQRACKRLLPKGGLPAPTQGQQQARVAELRQLATCMRSHGEPNFPDPSTNGNLLITRSSGIDPNSPQFQTAQKDCAQYFPGGAPPPPPNASPGG